ncbi:MAG: type VI secretion system baseplate subunit TssK [Pseudomonadota bacterium]
MSVYSKVAWKEGLFLQPHHFQQADRYCERLVEARTRVLSRYPWGLVEATFDRDMLQQGRIGLRALTGILPDGTPFDAPDAAPLPAPCDVPEDAAGLMVWLTLPDANPTGEDVGVAVEATGSRYRLEAETVADTTAIARSEHVVEIAVPRLELAVRETPRPGYQCLRLGRIADVRDGVVTLDDTISPPALVLAAHPTLNGFLSRVIGWVETKLESLSRYASDPSAGGAMQAEDYLMLMVLNRHIGGLRHLSGMHAVHPEELYQALLTLSGELATFDGQDRIAPKYSAYDHEDLKGTFTPLVQDIQTLLAREMGRATRLDLRQVQQNSYVAQVGDRTLFRDATFVLEVETNKALTLVQAQFPELCKIGPNTRMKEIVQNNLPGIGIVHLPNPPRQIRVISTNVYFLLDKTSPLWREFSTAPGVGMHFAGDWPDLKLELWAVPERAG